MSNVYNSVQSSKLIAKANKPNKGKWYMYTYLPIHKNIQLIVFYTYRNVFRALIIVNNNNSFNNTHSNSDTEL